MPEAAERFAAQCSRLADAQAAERLSLKWLPAEPSQQALLPQHLWEPHRQQVSED